MSPGLAAAMKKTAITPSTMVAAPSRPNGTGRHVGARAQEREEDAARAEQDAHDTGDPAAE